MQHILVGKWSRATRARDRRGQRRQCGDRWEGASMFAGVGAVSWVGEWVL